MKNNNQHLDFPENTPDIITELTEKYGIKENAIEIFSKIGSNIPTNGKKILELIERIKNNNLPLKDLNDELRNSFALDKSQARALANDIKNKFLKTQSKTNTSIKQHIIERNQNVAKRKSGSRDSYREPIT